MEHKRCDWCTRDDLYQKYHDFEWGVPVHEDQKHFEMLILEGMQAGLSWITVLKKRENFRSAFDDFDPVKVSAYTGSKIEELMQNKGIIRNRRKIAAAVDNAKAFLQIQAEYGSFDAYVWAFVGEAPLVGHWENQGVLPTQTPIAEEMSKALKKRGFSFVGPTIIYSYMQAVGMVNDHTMDCFCYAGKVR